MKKPIIKYTNRDFASIKQQLIEYAKINYEDTYKDFNKASFGAMMIDMIALIGDQLSMYLDYNANESMLPTAIQFDNVLAHAKSNGFILKGAPSSTGRTALYILVPANSNGSGPNIDYVPILEKGSLLQSDNGDSFMLAEDVDFSANTVTKVVAQVNETTGLPVSFALKTYATVISGEIKSETFEVGTYQKFLTLTLSGRNISEILSCVDSSGNEYYQVDYLSQNLIFDLVRNDNDDKDYAPYILQEKYAPRRFIVDYDGNSTSITFGFGSIDSVADPKKVALNMFGRNYITDDSFDPASIISSDKFGIAPVSTTLTVTYRANTSLDSSVGVGGLRRVISPRFRFGSEGLNPNLVNSVVDSVESFNEEAIVGGSTAILSIDELKMKGIDAFATQNRAVTREDYIAMAYRMDPKLGSVKRANIVQDASSFKRNLNMYIISEDDEGHLVQSNSTIKSNLKKWLASYKMVNDTVDILDAKIVNIGIDFTIVAQSKYNKYDALADAVAALKEKFEQKLDIGKPLYITDIYKTINLINSVADTKDVRITVKNGAGYAPSDFDIAAYMSPDGRFINVPFDVILEIKYPDSDIKGVVV